MKKRLLPKEQTRGFTILMLMQSDLTKRYWLTKEISEITGIEKHIVPTVISFMVNRYEISIYSGANRKGWTLNPTAEDLLSVRNRKVKMRIKLGEGVRRISMLLEHKNSEYEKLGINYMNKLVENKI